MKKHIYLPKSSYWLLLIIISTIIAQSINATTFKEANAKKMLVIATDDYLPDVYFGDEATVPISVLLSNDVGTGLQLQSVCTTSQGGGTIVNNGNGTITYTPPSSGPVLGSDSFCYTIIDTNGETATANVIFTFSFDFLLFAQDDIFSALFYGEPVSIMAEELLANDLGEFVQSVCTISAEGGTITDNGDGTFTYLPPAGVSFLESDSFCYTIANLEGYTASATVFLYFTNTNDPQLTAEAVCLYEDEYGQTPLGFFELTITVQGTCDEGYSWINFVNGDMGNVMYDTSLNMGIIYLEGLESDIGVGYSVEVINNCTGASNVIWNVVECAKHTGTDLGYVPIFVNYDTTVIIPEDMIYTNEYALSQWANFVDISFCETSENGGSFINNGDGTFIYTPPAAVNILSDQVCVTGFYEDNTTTETYIDLLFVNLQDPQVSVSTDCLAENMNYFVLNMMVLGQCEDGYAWVNNNNSGENGTVSNPLQFVLPNATDYNYTFTNNCTGEVVTISGEAPDCEITAYNIDAIDDPQDAVEYGNPVTIVSENLLLNDFGDNIQVQSVCTESVNGGTIVTNNDGTYTYYPPAGVDFLATDSFCYTIIDAYGYTATANVILYFYNNNNGQDPIIFTYVSCQSCDNGNATGYFDIAIELVGYCDEGYTWINNLNPSENGDVIYSGITNMGYFQIYDILAYVNGYDISITNNCTGEITTVTSEVVSCKEWDFFAFNYYELYLNYAQQIEITEAMLYENNSYGYYFLYEYESLVFCETSENGGNFTDNGDGTFLYEAPVGVDSLLLDKICVTLVFSDGTTIDTYVEMVFTNIQDPQFDIEINCCHQLENEVKVVYYLKGACEEGYYWVNNNNPAQNGNIYSFYDYFNYLPVIFPQEEGYNYTFTNNCTGEVVSISGEAPDCEITAYNIDAIDDPQDAVEYGNPVTVVSENLLLNDFGDNIQVQSVCTESVNGGTIVNNGDGTYTYYTPAGVDFLATDSFCYTIIDAYGYTATANVILYFYESQQDPTLSVSTECIYCGDYQIPIALFNLTIIVIGSCEEGYTWVNNLNPNEQGEVMYEAGVGYVFLPNLQAEGYNYSNGDYNITVTNECTGEMTTVSSSVDCIIATGPGLGYIPVTVDYATQILITQEMFDEYSGYFFGFSYSYENAEFCTVSENGGTFTDNGDGTYLYTAPLGVDSLFSDIICVSIYDEESGYTEETYLELIFVDIQDPQLETGLFCCGENDDAYINIKVKGVCGEGYTWVNNNDTTQGGLIYSYISNLTDLSFFVEESQGYNYTFTNNCTGEVVTISGEAPDCEITAYIIDAIDDPQDAVEYGNPVTVVSENLLLNDFGDNIQVQSVCTESVNGGTIVTNNDGTYTYYPPAGVNFLATDSFCYTIIDAYGYTATANVILYFYNNNGQDPIIDVMAVCINCDDSFFGTFNLYITVIGSCEEGYTWVNNLNPDDGGEVNYDAGVGAIYLTNMSSENGYDITVSNKCTGETATVASMVNCPSSFSWSDFITMVVDYAAEIVISEEYLNDVLMNMGIWYPIIEEYCTASENGGTFTDNGDGTYLYTAPLGVDSLLSDRICLSIYSEFYTYEVYLELVFANMQDPQIETNLLCCYYGGVYLKVLVKGVCEEGYTWVNNTLTEIEEIYTSNTYYSEDILLKIDESEGYNLTFTNNCTGESVTIAETDISANCYAGITANYDQLFSINYSPVTFSADTLLANDSYYNLSISSIDNTSAQGGTIVNNGDGTFTYYPPATVTSTTDIFTYTVVNASGTSTATANVVVSFIAADPIVAVSPDCQTEIIDGQEVSNGLYDLTLTLNGTCQAGYTWQNNNNSSESGEALPDSTGTAVIVLPNQSLTDNETYNITITNNCTGAAQTIAEIVNCTDPTAVDLLRFSGEVKDNGNLLSWVSASEKDNAYYTVESSRDGQNFTDIAQIAGAGTSSSAKQYQFLDANAGAGTTYYRLSWTEQSGTRHKHPSTVLLHRNGQNTNIIAVYPIPINDMLHLNYTSKIAGEINLKIYDILGRMVYEQELQTKVAINKVEIDMKQFPSGTYFLILSDGSEQTSTKFIKD